MSSNDPALSFARDIRPMFTDTDVEHMEAYGMDLSSFDEVVQHADAIYAAVSDGSMPPKGTGAQWTPQMCARFKAWQTQGCKP
ncbi:MAG TPA: hypothetical protein VKF82_01165 [Candidatus Eremiobacteraceae bacterium]|nr:hypothetical protein [Candidatus Eremiobacteraceae bacterium]